MTIKQLGGVFGRNPTFNDVTIEGELTFDGDIDINSDLKISQDFEVVGDSGFGAAPNSNYRINALDTSAVVMAVSRDGTDGDAIQIFNGAVFGTRCLGLGVSGSNGTINNQYGNIEITTSSTLIGKFTANGFAPEDGKGIDFSATAGTGTSELFADYEEGTWTAQLFGTSTNPTTPITSTGKYTRVGRQVTVTFGLSGNTTGASGVYIVNGFPYAIGAGSNYFAALVTANMGAVPVAAYGVGGNTYFALVEQTTFNYLPMSAGAGRSVTGTFTYFV
jgi:hypothetical protein